MLNTHIFLTPPDQPDQFTQISGDGLAPCVWELEIINHERLSWINNIMKPAPNPDFPQYLAEVYHGEL